MAPKKKGKKKPAAGDWGSDDDKATPDLAGPPSDAGAEEALLKAAQPAKKAKKPKKGKGKGKPGDDWGSEDDAPGTLSAPPPEGEPPREQHSGHSASNGKAAARAFSMLNGSDDGASSAGEEEPAAAAAEGRRPAAAGDEDDDQEQTAEVGRPVVARVLGVEPHPSAEKLRVCSLDVGGPAPVRVVTNATDVSAGGTVFVALPGSRVPGSGAAVSATIVRGVESSGMICSPADLGWDSSADACPAAVPDSLEVGDEAPASAPLAQGWEKSKKKKKKKGFEMGRGEEEADVPAVAKEIVELEILDSAAPAAERKPKKGKKTGFVMPADAEEQPAADAEEEPPAAVADDGAQPAAGAGSEEAAFAGAKSKKKKSKVSRTDVAGAFAELELGEDAAECDGAVSESPEDVFAAGHKKKKKGKRADLESMWAELDAESGAAAGASAPEEPAAESAQPPDRQSPAAESKAAHKSKAKAAEEEDIDALLAQLDGPKAAEPAPEAGTSGKKKKKKGKVGAAAKEEEDLDALLAEFAPPKAAEPVADHSAGAAAGEPPADAEDVAEAEGEEDDADGDGDEKNMSAAAKKKAKKKAKDKEKKAKEKEEGAAKGPKVTAAVRRMQEAQEARLRADADAKAAEDERSRKEEEERLAEEAASAAAEARDVERREKRAEARALAKKEGRLLTGKAKKEADRLAAMRVQLLARADPDFLPGAEDEMERPAKKKVVYGKKKGPKKGTHLDAAEETGAAAEEAAQAHAAMAEVAVAKVEEAAAPAAVAVSEAESEGADWDALDLDDIALPGQKSSKEIAAEKAAAEAAEKAAAEAAEKAAAEAAAEAEAARLVEEAAEAERAAKAEVDSEEESGSEEDDLEDESGSDDDSESESESESDSSSYESETDEEEAKEERIAAARAAREERVRVARLAGSRDELRSPICCILGHVDTGKTKILDNVRRTNVQDGEAGGITQQIGATYVPGANLAERTASLRLGGQPFELKVPGLLIIDTPGHESFTNLRSRGSSLCDIAILVVDIMHGLEQQTIESINLLKQRKTPFIIALNKVDRMFDWKAVKDSPIRDSFAQQKDYVNLEFEKRLQQSTLNLNEQGLNVALYWANPDPRKYVNIVPTSAITGEGIPDLLQLLVTLTQTRLGDRLIAINELQCTVLEVKVVEGLGTTMDVVLINGALHENDTVVVCGLSGPIVTPIRSLLTPHPMKELRVKGSYLHHKEVKAAQGIKIAAPGLESAVAGTQMLVLRPGDTLELLKEEVMADMQDIFSSVARGGEGVCVQASTLGSLEALLEFLKSPAVKIPVSGINIGPVAKRDVMRASVMLEKGDRKFGCILAFDVTVNKEARELAENMGVRIFSADIIYHLFDQFTAYLKQVKEDEQENARMDAVFPCILKIMPTCIFNKKDPIVLGVEVVEGIAKVGTPITIPSQGGIDLGRIASMELNHKAVDIAKKGDSVAMKLEPTNTTEGSRLYGRHFDFKDELVSKISRKSIDLLKEHFREDLSKDDWRLVVKLKSILEIV